MSLRTIGTLAHQRRNPSPGGSAASGDDSRTASLEAAVPLEVVALYTAIIAGCEAVLRDDPARTYLEFRVVVYALALACTILVALRQLAPETGGQVRAVRSPEFGTAVLSYAAWGLVLPGSFLYVWLDPEPLSVTVVTITALAAFIVTAVLAPRLRADEPVVEPVGPPLTDVPPDV